MVMTFDALTILLERDIVPEFMVQVYTTVEYPALIWVAAVLMAPLLEEMLVRGFLFAGWSRSRLGVKGTILLTSLGWAVVHLQYDFYGCLIIFVHGILLGIARHRTGSIWVPFLMHAVMNVIATLEVAYLTADPD